MHAGIAMHEGHHAPVTGTLINLYLCRPTISVGIPDTVENMNYVQVTSKFSHDGLVPHLGGLTGKSDAVWTRNFPEANLSLLSCTGS